MIGQTISHYKILEKVGEGGMGVVYKALDTKLDRHVALKFLPPHVTVSDDVKARFLQEAKAAAALNHPNICTIYGVDEHDGHYFIAMELIEGGTLREAVSKRQHSLEDYTRFGIQVGEALQEAHSKDIVHRDIKSENIMLTSSGQTKVMDFGLAKLKGSLKLTKTSSTVGTLAYMAPEQIQGGSVDHRSDIFSFGVLLFELLTGKMPFRGEHEAAMVYSIVNEEPTNIAQLVPSISPIIVNLIHRCLEKDPNDRYQSMQEAVIELRRSQKQTSKIHSASAIQSSSSYEATHSGASRPQFGTETFQPDAGSRAAIPWKLIAGLAGLIAIIAAGVLLYPSETGRMTYDLSAMTLERIPSNDRTTSFGLSPDGSYIVYVPEANGKRRIMVKHLTSGSLVEALPPTQDVIRSIEFGGSSSHFYFLMKDPSRSTGWLLKQMPILGGTIRTLRDFEQLDDFSISPDDKQVAYTRTFSESGDFSLLISDLDGTSERVLASDRGTRWFHSRPGWSPDGRTIVCPWGTTEHGWKHSVKAIDIASGEVSDPTDHSWDLVQTVRWIPDGRGFLIIGQETFAGSQQVWEVAYPEGNVKRVTNDLNNYGEAELSSEGSLLGSQTYTLTFSIVTLSFPGMKEQHRVRSATRDGQNGIAWTPDGKIVYTTVMNEAQKLSIMNPDGTDRQQLTYGPSSELTPHVTPDGQFIMFSSDRNDSLVIWRMRSDGTDLRQMTKGPEHSSPQASPDNAWFYYSVWDLGPIHIMRQEFDGSEPQKISELPGGNPRVSPDGRFILYSNMAGDSVHIMTSTGGPPQFSFATQGSRYSYRWHPNGNSITFMEISDEREYEIWQAFLDGRPPQKLYSQVEEQIADYQWSKDGSQLAFVSVNVSTDMVLFRTQGEETE